MHPFDEWFDMTYPPPQPPGTRETALITWNAAIRAAQEAIRGSRDRLVELKQYEHAALANDVGEEVRGLARVAGSA